MRKTCLPAMALAGVLLSFGSSVRSAGTMTRTEDFSTNPLDRGWRVFGDSSLFRWNATNQNLEVTWDSSRSNSYFQLPLNTMLNRQEDFRLELDLRLSDIAGGVNPEKPSTLQLAFGFQNRADAEQASFDRTTGANSPNLVEFDYFPDTGWGATVWPMAVSTNSGMNYNGSSDSSYFDLPTGVTMRIVLAYTRSNQTLLTSVSTNGVLVGPVTSAPMATNSSPFGGPFTDFRVDTLAIASYTDLGSPPGEYSGSLLAHGTVDNVVVITPPPAVQSFGGSLTGNTWQAEFLSQTNWSYILQTSSNLESWANTGLPEAGTGGLMTLQDTNAASCGTRFYRVRALRAD